MKPAALVLWLGLLVGASLHNAVGAQEVTYTGALFYAGGSYIFDRRSDAVYLSNGLSFSWGEFDVGVSVPVITQNGGVVTTVAQGIRLPTGGTENETIAGRRAGGTVGTRKGDSVTSVPVDSTVVSFASDFATHVGDPTVTASGQLHSDTGALRSIRFQAAAKAPLNDLDSGVGSGAWDFGAGASVVGAAGSVLLFVDAVYWWLGNLPDLVLTDGLSYGLGASTGAFSGRGSVLALLSGMTTSIETVDPPISIALSLSRSVGTRALVSGGFGVGLTESAPSFSAQVGWSIRFGAEPG
jgi:hypothetical protein